MSAVSRNVRRRGYVTSVSEPVTSDREAARVADARQAAYFRDVLEDRRKHLDAGLPRLRKQLGADAPYGDRTDTFRLRRQVQGYEYELVQLDRLIRRLDRRFTDEWAELDSELG
jgi:hypothetical protein